MVSTVHGRVAAAREQLRRAGLRAAEADLDARLLAQHLLGWDAARYFSSAAAAAPPAFSERYDGLVARRAAREPLAYILGHREFWGLTFQVTPAVLIPRPETELIVEATLQLFRDRSLSLAMADVCTGSGCLAVTLASEYPRAQVVATDLSADALDVAQRNARMHHVEDRIRFNQADLLPVSSDPFDLVVANPPYVPSRSRAGLQPEVRDYEPSLALFGGDDGLGVIRRLVPAVTQSLKPGGKLILEFGLGQADDVVGLISATPGLRMTALLPDLQSVPRAVVTERVGEAR